MVSGFLACQRILVRLADEVPNQDDEVLLARTNSSTSGSRR